MGRIYQRNGIWYLDVRANGRRIRKRIGKSKRIAELALKDAEVKIEREQADFAPKKSITIDQLIDKYLDYQHTHNRERTVKRYRTVFDHLRRYLSDVRPDIVLVTQLTAEVMDGYKAYRRAAWVNPNGQPVTDESKAAEYTRKGARARTVNLEVDAVKSLLIQAVKWGYIDTSPLRWVKPLKEDDRKLGRFLTKEECSALLVAVAPDVYPVIYVFLNTGMRKGELENLRWDDVDFERRCILIRRKADWVPKTGEREIPMSTGVFEILTKHRRRSHKAKPSDYVFTAKGSGHSHNRLRRELIKAAEKAGINDLTKLHTLRHTYASHLVMNGVDLATVQKLLGHTDIKTTMIYAHLAPDHLRNAVKDFELG